MDKSILINRLDLLETDFSPIYSQLYIHPEEGETFKINDKLNDIEYDLNSITFTFFWSHFIFRTSYINIHYKSFYF